MTRWIIPPVEAPRHETPEWRAMAEVEPYRIGLNFGPNLLAEGWFVYDMRTNEQFGPTYRTRTDAIVVADALNAALAGGREA
jgi:hypothetical protein